MSGIPLLRRPRPPKVKERVIQDDPYSASRGTQSRPITHISASTAVVPRSEIVESCTNGHRAPPNTTYTHYHGDVKEKEPFVINSLQPKGPKPLPCRAPIRRNDPVDAIDRYYYHEWSCDTNENDFTLNDLMQTPPSAGEEKRVIKTPRDSGPIMSKHSYQQLTSWFAVNVPTQQHINTATIEADDIQSPEKRKPLFQFLVELRAMVKEMSSEDVSIEEEDVNRPSCQRDDLVMVGTTSRYFCGEGRCGSPFSDADQVMIEPSEVAVLHCMMHGGAKLSVKAHFLETLPDLQPLSHTLRYLNVSFNNLRVFPNIIVLCNQLVCLTMRNNPIHEIPNSVSLLQNLRIFCISFCLLSDLAMGLFSLGQLEQLDVSHNSLKWLSRDIAKLSQLQKLNVEGNQLEGLPPGLLDLPLKQLDTQGNLMHALLWPHNTRNQPQRLSELCNVAVAKYSQKQELSESSGTCDCCSGPVFGVGLRLIRSAPDPRSDIFHHLPFILIVCSPLCHRKLRRHWSPC